MPKAVMLPEAVIDLLPARPALQSTQSVHTFITGEETKGVKVGLMAVSAAH